MYDPRADAMRRWPEWKIEERALMIKAEEMCPSEKTFFHDMQTSEVESRWWVAHAVGHLDAGHHLTARGTFTKAEEREADRSARRLYAWHEANVDDGLAGGVSEDWAR